LLIFFREVVRMPEEELGRFRTLPVWESRIGLAPTIPREVRVDEVYHFSPERWREMRTPTLLLLGSESPAPFRRAIEAVAAAVPDSRIVELGGQRHAAMDGAPELFVAEVLRFLQP
jgi:pimeloyl-ACP methyl ester carboxylesterase